MKWGPDEHAKLFLLILKHQNVSVDYQLIATEYGEGVTGEMIRHQIRSLKKKAGADPDSTAPTPKKPRAKAKKAAGGAEDDAEGADAGEVKPKEEKKKPVRRKRDAPAAADGDVDTKMDGDELEIKQEEAAADAYQTPPESSVENPTEVVKTPTKKATPKGAKSGTIGGRVKKQTPVKAKKPVGSLSLPSIVDGPASPAADDVAMVAEPDLDTY